MSKIVMAAELPEGAEFFSDEDSWQRICRMVDVDFLADTVGAKGEESRIECYVVIRTGLERFAYALEDNGKGGKKADVHSISSERPKEGGICYGSTAVVIETYGDNGWYYRDDRSGKSNPSVLVRVRNLFDDVHRHLREQVPVSRLELCIDKSIANRVRDIVRPNSAEDAFYLRGEDAFKASYRKLVRKSLRKNELVLT
ncbi:hypothetical protein KY361_00185 [Candidatus Woesearchaeota archaeon]|nr:hypothetical protein [Candidatus Woesearchaeota archaeon]